MAKAYAQAFYNSPEWRACRAAYISQVGGLCEDCLARGIYTPGYIVHHKRELTPENIIDPEVALNYKNLRLVCKDCHEAEHSNRGQRYRFGKDGRIIER